MIDKDLIAYFKLAHGFFNLCMVALFCAQAWKGFQIRQARTSGAPVPLDAVRWHRKAGPVFALWGVLGFVAGIVVVVLDKGRVVEYPLHFLGGISVMACLAAVYVSSRSIRGPEPRSRGRHFILGMLLIALYLVQMLLGLGILL